MFKKKLLTCFVCIIIGYSKVSSWINVKGVSNLTSYISIIWNAYYIDNYSQENFDFGTLQEIIDNLEPLSSVLLQIQKDVDVHKNLMSDYSGKNQIDKIYDEVLRIEKAFEMFLEIKNESLPNAKIDNFVDQLIGKRTGLLQALNNTIYPTLVKEKNNLLYLLDTKYEKIFYYFQVNSKQQYIYNLFLSVLDIVHKSFSILQLVHKNLEDRKFSNNIIVENRKANETVKNIYNDVVAQFDKVLRTSSRNFHKPDLMRGHQIGLTYLKLEDVFQRVLFSKKDFGYSNSVCPVNDGIRLITPACQVNAQCSIRQRNCPNVFDCKEAGSYAVCSLEENSISDSRRYALVENLTSQNNKISWCPGQDLVETSIGDYCDCLCDEQPESSELRAFSLNNVTAHVILNYVVVGVRLYREKGVLHLEIEEAKLLPAGFVSQETRKWTRACINSKTGTGNYHRISSSNGRGISFINAEVIKKDTFVTGVRFAVEKYLNENILKIEFQTTKFNFTTGALNYETKKWQIYNLAHTNSTIFSVGKLDVPQYVNKKHQVYKLDNLITQFEPTGFTTSDSGTSCGPFIDIQSVNASKAAPLVGINAQYLYAKGSIGYYQLYTISYDVMTHMYNLD